MNEVAGPSCLLLPPFDPAALARAIAGLMAADDTELLNRGLLARNFARRFDWDHIATEQEAFYLEVLASCQRQARA